MKEERKNEEGKLNEEKKERRKIIQKMNKGNKESKKGRGRQR